MRKKAEAIPDVIDNVRRLFQSINRYSKNAEKLTGLTGPQLWAMKLLANEAPIKVSELARQMYLHPATIVGILDRLEMKGAVTRTRSRKDRRVVEIELTGQGKELVAKAPEVAQGLLVSGLEALPEEQFDRVAEGMEQLVLMIGAAHISPEPLHG